jgi:hypothetical protein
MKQAEYDAIKAKIAELTATLENAEIEPEPKTTGWAGRGDDSFCFIKPSGEIDVDTCSKDNHFGSYLMYDIANKFTDDRAGRAKAEQINANQLAYRLLKRFSDENGGGEIDWKNQNQDKWYFAWDHRNNDFRYFRTIDYQQPFRAHFISKEICQAAVKEYRPQIMAAMGGDEE